MAGTASVLTDNSFLSRLDQRLFSIEKILVFIGGLAIFSLMVLAVFSVGGRNFFNRPLSGYVDWIEQIMPLIAFVGIAYTQRVGGHIRMDILVGQLKGRPLWLAEFVATLAMLLLMILLVWGSWAHFQRSFDFSVPMWSRDSSIDIGLPLWPAKLLAPVAFFILTLRLLIQLWGFGRAFATNATHPVAVPMIEDAATQAQREAETVSGLEEDSK